AYSSRDALAPPAVLVATGDTALCGSAIRRALGVIGARNSSAAPRAPVGMRAGADASATLFGSRGKALSNIFWGLRIVVNSIAFIKAVSEQLESAAVSEDLSDGVTAFIFFCAIRPPARDSD